MRYVIVDPEGASRGRFHRLQEVQAWARTLVVQDAELLDELMLMTYDAAGNEVASQWLSEFVPNGAWAGVVFVGTQEGLLGGLELLQDVPATPVNATVSAVSAEWSGRAMSTTLESRHLYRHASGTHSAELAEMAVG
jgi:hypothetical protein